jgi:hypothetical protein
LKKRVDPTAEESQIDEGVEKRVDLPFYHPGPGKCPNAEELC